MSEARSKSYFLTLGILLSLSAVIAFLAPRFLAFIPSILGVLGLALYRPAFGKWPDIFRYPLGWMLALLVLSFASISWSVAPDIALERSVKLAVLLLSGSILIGLDFKSGLFKSLASVFPLLIFALAVFIGFELVTVGGFYTNVYEWPDPTKMQAEGFFNLSHYNRATVFLALAFWPALSLLRQSGVAWRRDLILAMSAAILFVLALTESQTAQIGFAAAAFFYFLFPIRCKFAWMFVLLAIALVFMTLPDIVPLAYDYLPDMIRDVPWFENSYALERLDIWNFLSGFIKERPLLGYGIEATRELNFGTMPQHFPGTSVLHPHNFMLQVWMEFGAAGVIFFILFFIQSVQIFMRQEPKAVRLNSAVFFSVLAMSLTGYGMWQGWWLGTILILYVLCQTHNAYLKSA